MKALAFPAVAIGAVARGDDSCVRLLLPVIPPAPACSIYPSQSGGLELISCV
ncbi:MAG: hypothetical protein JWN85_1649 [Gammaproteobacteria bacterium]|nr:hypothetical protein [Gammaproteobacteria bacterium]